MSSGTIVYPELVVGEAPVRVEPLDRQRAIQLGSQILHLIVATYAPQLEGPNGPLPEGSFADRYSPDRPEALERGQQEVIPPIFTQGGGYSAIFAGSSLVAYLKARSRIIVPEDHRERRFNGMAEIGEILTHPEYQGRGLGAALLHAYFRHQNVSPAARVMLEAFEDSAKINEWYVRLGFEPEESADAFKLGNLPMRYYVTPERVSVQAIIRRLEEQRPELRSGISI